MERRLLPYAKQKAGLRLEADERDESVKREMKRLFAGMRERKRREAVVLRVDDGVGAGAKIERESGTTDAIAGADNKNKGLVIPPGMVVQSPASRLASDLAAFTALCAPSIGSHWAWIGAQFRPIQMQKGPFQVNWHASGSELGTHPDPLRPNRGRTKCSDTGYDIGKVVQRQITS